MRLKKQWRPKEVKILKLISVRELAEILKVTMSWVHDKIKNEIIKPEWVIKLPPQSSTSPLRINYDNLVEAFPDIKTMSENPNCVLKVEDLAGVLNLKPKTIYLKVNQGVYPTFTLPSYKDRKVVRINKLELIKKFPELEQYFK
jgi:hypothetical protein